MPRSGSTATLRRDRERLEQSPAILNRLSEHLYAEHIEEASASLAG